MLAGFFHHTPVKKPESVRPFLSVSEAQDIKDQFPESNLIVSRMPRYNASRVPQETSSRVAARLARNSLNFLIK